MKKIILFTLVSSLMFWSCGNSNSKTSENTETAKQTITKENIIGEWQCIDITNGVTHMESIAKMQPHIIFNEQNEIFSKMKLPDGSFAEQKIGSFKIADGTIQSELYEVNLYIENDKLVIEDPSADNKQLYIKSKK